MADKKKSDYLGDLDWVPKNASEIDINLDSLLRELSIQISPDELTDFDTPPAPPVDAPANKATQTKTASKTPVIPPIDLTNQKAPQASKSSDEELPSNTFLDTVEHHRKIINTCLILIVLVLVAGISALVLLQGRSDPYKGRILNNVSVAGVDVSGMKTDEAVKTVKAIVGNSFEKTDMVVSLGKTQVILSPASTHAAFHAEDAVSAAFAFGRTGNTAQRQQDAQEARSSGKEIALKPYLGIDETYVRSVLSAEIAKISGEYTPSGYTLEGQKPGLDADSFDEAAPCQTLMLTIGTPGSNADLDAIVDAVMEAYSRNDFQVTIPLEKLANFPEELDLDAIHSELTIAPVEASENKVTKEVTAGSCGYTFSLEDAKAKLSEADYGDVIAIPMEYVKPAKLDIIGDFPESLGVYSTPLSNDAGYNHNMELICESIDGIVLQPGATFSFDMAAVARTESNGFVSAPIHDKYCATQDISAGADQVASTLYVAAINADLAITERHSADHACGYTLRGTELTVLNNWNDLKFRNTQEKPIKIRAKVTDTQVVIRILGQTAPKYYMSLEVDELSTSAFGTAYIYASHDSGYQDKDVIFEGLNGGQIQLYRVKYDRATQKEISRTREAFIEIHPASKLIAQVK